MGEITLSGKASAGCSSVRKVVAEDGAVRPAESFEADLLSTSVAFERVDTGTAVDVEGVARNEVGETAEGGVAFASS